MLSRPLLVTATALVLAGTLTGYLLWRNSPQQVARRYLQKLARTATVYPEDSTLNRRLRPPRLGQLLGNPLELRFPEANVSSVYDLEELLSGYVLLISEGHYFEATFSRIRLRENRDDLMRLTAQLNVQSNYPAEQFPIDESVELDVKKIGDLLLLSRVATANPPS